MGSFAQSAIPIGASLGASWLAGRNATSSAMQRSPEENAALSGATGAARNLSAQGQGLTAAGMPAVTNAATYYDTLLRGNRASMNLATAGPRAALTDQYRGAARGIERSGLRGGARDLATSELGRDQAGRVAGLTTGLQPGAASANAQLGTALTGQGTAALYGVGNVYSQLLREATQNRMYGRDQGQQAGNAWGSAIFDILGGGMGGGAGGAGGSSGGSWWQRLLGLGGGAVPGFRGNDVGTVGQNDPGTTGYFDAGGNWVPTSEFTGPYRPSPGIPGWGLGGPGPTPGHD